MSERTPSSVTFALTEPAETPWLGVVLGDLSLQLFDPTAAPKREASLYFARLRPARTAVPVVCLLAVIVLLIVR